MHQEGRAAGPVITFVLVVASLALAALVLLQPPPIDPDLLAPDGQLAPTWAEPVELPAAAEEAGTGIAGLVDPEWLTTTSAATGIPERALAAYAGATLYKAETMPQCTLSWTTVAAIGEVESDHGRYNGSSVQADGTVAPPIFGIPLDGNEVADIPDSDGGEIDGDATIDRAVGPMQLIPQTWRNWHVDGNGDGVEDPQNIDDAALATTNYLCRVNPALGTEDGWRAAIRGYNDSTSYLSTVASFAQDYAEALDTASGG